MSYLRGVSPRTVKLWRNETFSTVSTAISNAVHALALTFCAKSLSMSVSKIDMIARRVRCLSRIARMAVEALAMVSSCTNSQSKAWWQKLRNPFGYLLFICISIHSNHGFARFLKFHDVYITSLRPKGQKCRDDVIWENYMIGSQNHAKITKGHSYM